LVLIYTTVIGWYFFNACWLTYLELLFYNPPNLEKIDTTFNPTFNPLFFDYSNIVRFITGFMSILTVCVLLYSLKKIPIVYKIIYLFSFLGLILYTTLMKSKAYFDGFTNKSLGYIKYIFNSIIR
jgi:hypothetical protein